jgi:mannitol/fructose-specific phosphotransferase system IIA component (Ntr-type)
VIGVACIGKLLGAGWGARLGGMDKTSSLAVGLAMNARGAMEIILGILALQAGLIRENMFVAMVIMALFTSLISAPAIHFLIRRKRNLTLKETVSAKLFIPNLTAQTRLGALREMCEVAAEAASNAPERLLRLVSERERVLASGWENELAVPHVRVDGLGQPLVVVAKTAGIDFDARDGKPARLIILILTGDNQSQQDLLADASELFSRKEAIEQAVNATNFLELVAALNAPVH